MALADNALVTVAEVKAFLAPNAGSDQDTALESVINRASDLIGSYVGRNLIKPSTDVTAYCTLDRPQSRISPPDWPLASVTTIHEDEDRAYGADTLLVEGTDYILSKPPNAYGQIIRIDSSTNGERAWEFGLRAVRVLYKAGWTVAALPARFKDAALHLIALLWQEQQNTTWGESARSDGAGNITRVTVSHLPAYVRERLDADRDYRSGGGLWERDA